jgi:hypothetical protein
MDQEQAARDAAVEVEIDIAYLQFATARTPAQRKRAHERFERAIKARSPRAVRRMELERGLRRQR